MKTKTKKVTKILVAPSILSADPLKLEGEAKRMEKAGADLLHVDVMDGKFVERTVFGIETAKKLKKATKLPLDVHLMICEPWKVVKEYAKAGASRICVHVEAGSAQQILKTIKLIKSAGCKAGVAIKPDTPLESIDTRILKECDFIMPMTVNPGASGQPLIEEVLLKIARLQVLLYKMKLEKQLEGDGGINSSTAAWFGRLGVTVLVSGAGIFHSKYAKRAIMQLRKAAGQVK